MSEDMNTTELKKDWIAKSNQRFKKVSLPEGEGKFKKLPRWLDNVSYRYNQESENKFPQKYYHYSRGTIIQVDFGINMGSEFCGPHFAIVLDKKDNSRKRTLTVVPLTSKEKSGRFPLGKEVFNQTVEILKQQADSLIQQYNQLIAETDDSINESNRLIDTLKANGLSDENKKATELHFKNVSIHNQRRDKVKKSYMDLKKIIDIYSHYNKNSFVRLTDITTISKFRIKRINKFDPSGRIKLSEQQMESISQELMSLFITK